jgi:hypothetical protein
MSKQNTGGCAIFASILTVAVLVFSTLTISLNENAVKAQQTPFGLTSQQQPSTQMMTNDSSGVGGGSGSVDGGVLSGMSTPFRIGVLTMPMTCTTPAELLSTIPVFNQTTGERVQMTNEIMMQIMSQQLQQQQMPGNFSGGGTAIDNFTQQQDLQQAMQVVTCFPMMDQAMQGMMMGGGGPPVGNSTFTGMGNQSSVMR